MADKRKSNETLELEFRDKGLKLHKERIDSPGPERQCAEHRGTDLLGSIFRLGKFGLPGWTIYATAALLSLATLWLRAQFDVFFLQRPLLIIFTLPIILSAFLGGWGPGLLSTLISALGTSYYFIPPIGSLRIAQIHDLVQWSVLIVSGLLVSGLCEILHRVVGVLEREKENLRQSQETFKALVENSPDAISRFDAMARHLYANPSALKYLDFSWSETKGKSHSELGCAREVSLILDARIREVYDTATPCEFETPGPCGCSSVFLWRLVPEFGAHGQVSSVLGVSRDITERKRDEDALRSAMRHAETASKTKSEFLANMSHEIRTPMNGILGMLQLMGMTELDKEQEGYVQGAVKSSHRLTRLLSDILDLSRVEAGRMELDEAEFRLHNQKESVLDLFAPTAREKGLNLEFNIAEDLPLKLLGDEARLRQILFNLVGNALKFTDKGSVRLNISRLKCGLDSLCWVLFTVEDTGIGIPEDKLRDIFEPFVQVEGSYLRKHQGAGLGLSIASKLVKLMGGGLSIDETEGGGTTVYLSLPFKHCDPRQRQTGPGESLAHPQGLGLRILFAEDDAMSMLAGKVMLEKSGYRVSTAQNGQEALELLAGEDFDLILMDVQMPVMDGVQATRKIRNSANFGPKARIPIIAMTAYAMRGDREKFLAAGMDEYIAKPVEAEALKAVIQRVISQISASGGPV